MLARVRRRRLWVTLSIVLVAIAVTGLGLYLWLVSGLPAVDDLSKYTVMPSSYVYDRYGRLLFEMPPPHTGSHSPVPLAEMPEALRQATIATEDANFYTNPGVDAVAIIRALWIDLRGGEILSGGSTITQQLARNLLLSPEERYEQTLKRKLREAILAWRLTQRYSKDEILALYLNEIYYGNLAYGVQAAAQAYFDKDVRDLDLAECALLAGLPQAPAYYNPLENLKATKARQAVVLDLMVKQGYITADQARMAKEEKLYLASAPFDIRAPHFVMYVRGLLEQELGLARLEQGGLKIYTTLDLDLNETARDLARYRLARLAKCDGQVQDCPPGGRNVRNAALIAIDPQTGEILAMLGSPDYFSTRIDGAVNSTTALRQPGSSIKPITYAAAFASRKLTPATMMLDVRTSFVTREGASYVPLNYDLQFRGPVRLREALASSYNLLAVKVLDAIGVDTMTGLARRMGITTFDDPDRLGLAVTLGGGEVRLLELTAAYGAFANGGYRVQPRAILRVEDAQGQILWSQSLVPPSPPGTAERGRVLDGRVAYLISDILSDDLARIPSFGDGSVLELSRPAAVKTGTTTDYRDNWTVGYTPDLVVGVWVGNADNETMHDISGISGAAPIWHDFMEAALKGRPVREFERPDGLVEVEVCALSGLLPAPDCPHRVTELFLAGAEPTESCTMHQRIAVDHATGLRATAATPPDQIVERVYTILPPEAQEWGREQGIQELPAVSSQLSAFSFQLSANPESKIENPKLTMVGPDAGSVYRLDPALPRESQRILVSAVAGGGVALVEVVLYVDGLPLARFGAPPYKVMWQLEAGQHRFWAEGVDAGGER
ncbi:MAG: PBP1A family penicillin-binding protein, partial [Anaerolineae bacterium]|nr:PBP1A family penicillin-binding protein [Anaerolineae bacterium]